MDKIQEPGTNTYHYSLKCSIWCVYYFIGYERNDKSLNSKIVPSGFRFIWVTVI